MQNHLQNYWKVESMTGQNEIYFEIQPIDYLEHSLVRNSNYLNHEGPMSDIRSKGIILRRLVKFITPLVIIAFRKEIIRNFLIQNKRRFPVLLKHVIKQELGYGSGKSSGELPLIRSIKNELFRRDLQTSFGLLTSKDPLVSVILPYFNKIEMTLECLLSIRRMLDSVPYEVLCVDDASTDPRIEVVKRVRGVRHITNSENQGYLKSNNLAAKEARGKYLLLLNNDTLVTNGWMSNLVKQMDSEDDIAICGSKLISTNGMVAEAGSEIFHNGDIWNLGTELRSDDALVQFSRYVDYCSAASILVKKSFWDQVEGFDIRFVPAYFEDTDLCMQAWNSGFKVKYVPSSVVIHIGGASHGQTEASGIKSFQRINRHKFFSKWPNLLVDHKYKSEIGKPRYTSSPADKGIVLVFGDSLPDPKRDAGSQKELDTIYGIKESGYHVACFYKEVRRNPVVEFDLQSNGIEIYFDYDQMLRCFSNRKQYVKAIVLSRFVSAENFFNSQIADWPESRIYFDTLDIVHLREIRQHEKSNLDVTRNYLNNLKLREINCVAKATETWVVSKFEKSYLEELGYKNIKVIPWSFDAQSKYSPLGNYFLFVGNFNHAPNIDALDWLLQEVLPKLERNSSNVQIKIVGAGLSQSMQDKLKLTKIEYLGWLEDLTSIYNAARCVIVPLTYGAGIKGKFLEAMSFGKVVISTSVGAEGISVEPGKDFILADNSEDFANRMGDLINDPQKYIQVGISGNSFIRNYYSKSAIYNSINESLQNYTFEDSN